MAMWKFIDIQNVLCSISKSFFPSAVVMNLDVVVLMVWFRKPKNTITPPTTL